MSTASAINVEQIVSSARDEIRESVVRRVKDEFSKSIGYALQSEVSEIVKEYVKTELEPEIRRALEESRPQFLGTITASMEAIGREVAKALGESVAKNLSQSWNVTKLADALFK